MMWADEATNYGVELGMDLAIFGRSES